MENDRWNVSASRNFMNWIHKNTRRKWRCSYTDKGFQEAKSIFYHKSPISKYLQSSWKFSALFISKSHNKFSLISNRLKQQFQDELIKIHITVTVYHWVWVMHPLNQFTEWGFDHYFLSHKKVTQRILPMSFTNSWMPLLTCPPPIWNGISTSFEIPPSPRYQHPIPSLSLPHPYFPFPS